MAENPGPVKALGLVVNGIAGLVALGSGIYLLAQYSETGPTWLEVIAHGSGAFFVACGLYMMGSAIAAAGDRLPGRGLAEITLQPETQRHW